MKTTNYNNAFIHVAEDTRATRSAEPPHRESPSIAQMQYDMIKPNPYRYTSDDVIFSIYANRTDMPECDRKTAREKFFAKGQACLRTSPLAKTYGWGIHHDEKGRVALIPMESEQYNRLSEDSSIQQVKAMRSKRG